MNEKRKMLRQPESQERAVSDDEASFRDWLGHPETVRFRAFLRANRAKRMENWASARYVEPDPTGYVAQNSLAMGYCAALKDLEQLDYETLIEGLSDEK